MNDFKQKIKEEAGKIMLSARERETLRARVYAAMGTPAPSPYVAFSFQFTSFARYALAGLLVFVSVGIGTVSAAYGALPGDVLYPVKVSINERVELALATTPQEKFEAEVRLAERRAAEAEALEAKGRLDATITIELEEEFDRHVSNALAFAKVAPEEEREEPAGEGPSEPAAQDAEVSTTLSLKVEVDESADAATMQFETAARETTVATDTATTTDRDSDDDDWFETLTKKRQILRELRERHERRSGGEVQGKFDWRDDPLPPKWDEDDLEEKGSDGEKEDSEKEEKGKDSEGEEDRDD